MVLGARLIAVLACALALEAPALALTPPLLRGTSQNEVAARLGQPVETLEELTVGGLRRTCWLYPVLPSGNWTYYCFRQGRLVAVEHSTHG